MFNSILGFTSTTKIDLVNIANEQRILSQKITKYYSLLVLNNNLPKTKNNLNISISKFENNLTKLLTKAPFKFTNVAIKTIHNEAATWQNLKVNVLKRPTTKNYNKVIQLTNTLLKKSYLAYIALKTEATIHNNNNINTNTNLKELLSISEKQEILSERLCLYFVAQKINVTTKNAEPLIFETLQLVVEKLDYQLITLLETNINTSKTAKIINNALVVFRDIKINKTDFLDGKPSIHTIQKTTKELNKLFKALSIQYTKLITS